MEPFWLMTAIVLLLPTIEEVEQEVEEEIQGEELPATPLARRSRIRMNKQHRIVRARDLIRSRLKKEWR